MLVHSFVLTALFSFAWAATAGEWRGRSIYQIITDRFALSDGVSPRECDPGRQTWCGGTWNSIREHLDYIQDAGFTAIWISPVNQNYEGPRTPYGDPYHGYWMGDITKLNNRFGTADDLKSLAAELHRRDMYLMVDIVVNNVMATSTRPDYSSYFFKNASFYHPYCPIQWGNETSEQICWMGDERVPLPDVDTSNPTAVSRYQQWIEAFVKEYSIDGLRIDAAKHVKAEFWPKFCGSSGVFCMGEVYGGLPVDPIAKYQGPQALDSVLHFPLYAALKEAFAIPGPLNMTALTTVVAESKQKFHDTTLLGNFLENHDVPRWHNFSVDPQSMYNAMTFTFLSDGIPIVYYGQEQYFHGSGDPYNREALWPSNYTITPAYNLTKTLNTLRNFLVSTTDWVKEETHILSATTDGIAIQKGPVISILTNIGSPPYNGTHIPVTTPYETGATLTNVLTCKQWVVGSQGQVEAQYSKGGVPNILLLSKHLVGSGLCEAELQYVVNGGGKASSLNSSDPRTSRPATFAMLVLASAAALLSGLTLHC